MTNEFYRSNYGQLGNLSMRFLIRLGCKTLGKALFSGMMVTAAAA